MNFVQMKAVKAFAISVVLSGVVVGCQDTNVSNTPIASTDAQQITKVSNDKANIPPKHWETLTFAADKQAINTELIALAKAVAVTVNDPVTRKSLHDAVLKRFDGDTEVLWSGLNSDPNINKQASQNNVQNWSAMVAQKADKGTFASTEAVNATVARAAKEYHANVHLFWFEADKWDKTTSPIVAFVPVGCDPEKENIILSGYDANGRKYAVDKEFALKNPVIVINANERTNADGSVREGFVGSPAQSNSQKGSASLQSGSTLGLQWTQFYNESNEGWFNGDPEIWLSIHSINSTAPTYTSFEWGRWYCSYYWGHFYGQIHYWNGSRAAWWNQDMFRTLRFQWIEQDPGTTIELTIGATYKIDSNASVSATGKIATTDQSDILGAATISFDDPVRSFYTYAPNFGLSW